MDVKKSRDGIDKYEDYLLKNTYKYLVNKFSIFYQWTLSIKLETFFTVMVCQKMHKHFGHTRIILYDYIWLINWLINF